MALYEHIFLVRQDVTQQQVEALTEQIKTQIASLGGAITKVEPWGLKSLAFRIKKNRKAHFTLMNIAAPSEAVTEVERLLSINEDVIRYLTIRVDEHEAGPSVMLRKREDSDRDDRGPRGDDALRALRASLSVPEPAYHGEFYSFGGMVVDPCAVQEHVPIWIGGRTLRSLRRAATLADGWAPFNVTLQQAREWLGRFDLPIGFEVVLAPPALLDPINDPERTRDVLADTAAHGATNIRAVFAHTSLQHYLEILQALAELHPPDGAGSA